MTIFERIDNWIATGLGNEMVNRYAFRHLEIYGTNTLLTNLAIRLTPKFVMFSTNDPDLRDHFLSHDGIEMHRKDLDIIGEVMSHCFPHGITHDGLEELLRFQYIERTIPYWGNGNPPMGRPEWQRVMFDCHRDVISILISDYATDKEKQYSDDLIIRLYAEENNQYFAAFHKLNLCDYFRDNLSEIPVGISDWFLVSDPDDVIMISIYGGYSHRIDLREEAW